MKSYEITFAAYTFCFVFGMNALYPFQGMQSLPCCEQQQLKQIIFFFFFPFAAGLPYQMFCFLEMTDSTYSRHVCFRAVAESTNVSQVAWEPLMPQTRGMSMMRSRSR